ncbi:MAG: enoyl-CoA hydratase/isomerase family protein [Spongiibacteraceae bacterium]
MERDFPVCLERYSLSGGGYLAQLTLNIPHKINALSLNLVELLHELLLEVASDPDAVAVFLDGRGERGFCSGANVHELAQWVLDSSDEQPYAAELFLARQYAIAHLIHHFPKPVIVWGHGVLMGGGIGFMTAGSHRIVTESSCIALPESNIGYFPDVGASWYLNHMPGKTGLYMALTGVQLSAADALYSGLADYYLPDHSKNDVLRGVLHIDWCDDPQWNSARLTEYLTDVEVEADLALATSSLKSNRQLIDKSCAHDEFTRVVKAIASAAGHNSWMENAARQMSNAAASSSTLVFQQLRRSKGLSLADIFRQELVVAVNRVQDPEFIEGVRARLVDRDRDPHWCYQNVSQVPDAEIEALYSAPWRESPLDALI